MLDVRYLRESEYDDWGRLVAESPQGSVYSTPDYLECLCSAAGGSYGILGCYRGDELVGGLGLYMQDNQRGRTLSNRWLLLYYNSIVLKSHPASTPYRHISNNLKTLSAIEEYLSGGEFIEISLHNRHTLNDFRPFLKKGWSVQPRYTYVVPVSDPEKMWHRVDQNLRRLVKRCEDKGAVLSTEVDFDRFYEMHMATHERKGSPVYLPREVFRTFVNSLISQNLAKIYHVVLPDGRSIAAQLVLLGRHSVTHTICAAADGAYLNIGATPFLRVKVFEALSAAGYEANDLTDAGLELSEVTRFKAQLGGDLVTNFLITKTLSLQGRSTTRSRILGFGDASEKRPTERIRTPYYECFSEFFDSMAHHRTLPAIISSGIPPLTFGELQGRIETIVSFLNSHGLGRNDRIGVIIPDGPDMAVVFLGILACATFVPFMQHYSKEEYESLMSNIGIKALIVQEGSETHALSVAMKRNLTIIGVKREKESEAHLEFTLKAGSRGPAEKTGFAESYDTAMVLTTSGTTSLPKIVPLTYANVFSSACYIAEALRLTSSDRSLHVLPMVHMAGLISAIISPLVAGGSIICTPGFSAELFFDWLGEFKPTWYTAVPTMHQAVVEVAERNSLDTSNTSLRFIRSVASPIAEPLVEKFEDLFRVPFIQAYGMTEALTITCTPLDPYKRKPESVGVAFCPEVAIIDDHGSILGTEETGEIAVRGPYVFKAYENNPDANEQAFIRGWFRTGDVGRMDDEGYLYVTGRVKDIINRGGQKVSPHEVEAALLSHPAVRDACVFGVKHTRLGEAVVAAVILKDDCMASEREIRHYIAAGIADYKVPQQIIFVTDIPKNDLGKVQRTEVCDRFLLQLVPEHVAPATEMEVTVAKIWREVLDVSDVGRYDNFFALGGDSLLATQMVSQIKKEIGIDLPLVTIFQYTTLKEFSEVVFRDPVTAINEKVLFDLISEIEGLTDQEARESLLPDDIPREESSDS